MATKVHSNGAEACKLTPCGTPLRAATGRSQASAPLPGLSPQGVSPNAEQASELIGCAVPQGGEPAQPAALSPAGGPVATTVQARAGAAGPPPSSLDTFGITRPAREGSAPGLNVPWLQEMGARTQPHREQQARHYDAKAASKRARLRLAGANERQVHDDTSWHRARARGQRNKIENVMSCGAEVIRSTCQACGCSHERPGRCGNSALCVRCRGAYQAIKRAAFLRARLLVLSEATARGLMNRNRRRGRFSEKFVTLTAPHLADDTIASRIDRIVSAWSYFRRTLKQHLSAKDAPTFDWFRVFEWTVGADGLGHPHIHVWMLSAYLDADHVRELWRAALLKAGCPPQNSRTVIVDIEEFKPNDGRGAQELIKYLTKDIDANGDKVPAAVYAEVYKAFDGRRMTQASRGFMALAKQEARRCECGVALPRRVRRIKPEPPSSAAPSTEAP